MENNQLYVLSVILFLIGGLIGAAFFSGTTEVEVPGETVTVYETVEVEVSGETVEVERDYRQEALSEFLLAAEDEEDEAGNDVEVLECSGDNYDFDEVSVSKVYDSWTLEYSDEDEYTVDFEVKLKYKESDERSCRDTYDVTVTYEEGEDTEVEAVLQ